MISFSRMIFSVWLDGHFLPLFDRSTVPLWWLHSTLLPNLPPFSHWTLMNSGNTDSTPPIKSILDSPWKIAEVDVDSPSSTTKIRSKFLCFYKVLILVLQNPQHFDWQNPTKTGHEIPVSCKNLTFCQQFWWTFWVSSSSLGWSFFSQRTWNKSSNFIFPVHIYILHI